MMSEDRPIGGGDNMMEMEQPPAAQASAPSDDGPLESRLKSKNFGTRAGAIEELKTLIDKKD